MASGRRAPWAFSLEKDTIGWIKAALPHLNNCSPERIRDEVFRIFEDAHPERALRVLDTLGGMDVLFPELLPLKETPQTAPHQLNAWDHSLAAVSSLEEVMTILTCQPDGEGKGNWLMGMISLHLGRYPRPYPLLPGGMPDTSAHEAWHCCSWLPCTMMPVNPKRPPPVRINAAISTGMSASARRWLSSAAWRWP